MPEAMFNLKFLNIMANYSFNQVRHLYIADAYLAVTNMDKDSNAKTIGVQVVDEGAKKQMYFLYKGAKTLLKSDLIDIKNIDSIKVIKGSNQAIKMKKVEISLTAEAKDENNKPIVGQDYVLGINFRNFFSSGDASQYYKNAAVHVTSSIDTVKKLFDAMKLALDKAFSREDGATPTSNPYLSFSVTGSGASAKLVIEEKAQEWELGTKKARRIMFDVIPGSIYTGGEDVIWGTAADITFDNVKNPSPTVVKNGQQIADLEWACMGERGDQYRNVGWPNVIKTEYLADSTKQYNLIEIHYAFTDTGVNSYRTEKELTIAVPDGAVGEEYDVINTVIGAINSATGLSISTLS